MKPETTILITGSTGFLGHFLMDFFKDKANVFGLARSGADINCDLKDFKKLKSIMVRIKPDIVIHTAALIDVDFCEKNQEEAYNENVFSTNNLLKCINFSTKLVFISTIAVYPNIKGLHKETNVGPVNFYGKTKLICENNIKEHKNHLILRTVFFGFSKNKKRMTLCDHLLVNLRKKLNCKLYKDEFFAPVHVETLVSLIYKLIEFNLTGIFNIATREGKSKLEFGLYFCKILGFHNPKFLISNASNDIKRTTRALDSRLSPIKLEKAINVKMPSLYTEMKKLL
jgi:dTDP-4-dehydrorhamnose reductase